MPQPARFQFSLRELLLIITTIGASLALVLQNVHHLGQFRGTALTQNFSLQASINPAASSGGSQSSISHSGGGGSSSGPKSRELTESYGFRIPQKYRQAALETVREKVAKILTESKCKIDGGGREARSFHWLYYNESLCGVVKVEMRDDLSDPEYTQVTYFAVEFKK